MQQQRGSWGQALLVVVALVATMGIAHQIYQHWRPQISCSADVVGTEESMSKQECRALAAIYDANVRFDYPRSEWNGFVPRPMRDWVDEPNPCLWQAVVCRSGHLTELSIVGDNSTGQAFLGYAVIPPEIGELSHLTRLTIDTIGVESLPSELGNLSHLTTLRYRGDISDDFNVASTIAQLTSLEELYLYSDATQELPDELLDGLVKLPHLARLTMATSGEFPPQFLEMTGLTSLSLLGPEVVDLLDNDGGGFSELPSEIGRLDKLTELNLSGQSLTTLDGVGAMPNLRTLSLASNQLTAVPNGLGQLTSLDLSGNHLAEPPADALAAMPNLRSLQLAANELTAIPSGIGDLQRLEELDLSSNDLTELPAEIGQMASLSSLDLGGNGLSTVPAVVFELNPSRLDLSSNRFSEFPLQPGQLSNVAELDLAANDLTEFPVDVALLPNLSKLSLRSNGISELPAAVGDLSHLTHLDLSRNYDLHDVDALIPFVQVPGYEERLDLELTCATSTEPRLQKLIDETRDWGLCGDTEERSD